MAYTTEPAPLSELQKLARAKDIQDKVSAQIKSILCVEPEFRADRLLLGSDVAMPLRLEIEERTVAVGEGHVVHGNRAGTVIP